MLSVRLLLAIVSGEGRGTVATPALVSGQVRGTVAAFPLTRGIGEALLPRPLLIEDSSPLYGLDGTRADLRLDCAARRG